MMKKKYKWTLGWITQIYQSAYLFGSYTKTKQKNNETTSFFGIDNHVKKVSKNIIAMTCNNN